jgi:hypothetical protein
MLAACTGDTGLVGFTRVLEGVGLGRGVLWVGAGEGRAVGDVQNAGEKRGGGPGCCSLISSLSHGSGRDWGCWTRPRRLPGAWLQGLDERRQ